MCTNAVHARVCHSIDHPCAQDLLDLMDCLCAFVTQKVDVNTSLTAITTLWSITDFIKRASSIVCRLVCLCVYGAHSCDYYQ